MNSFYLILLIKIVLAHSPREYELIINSNLYRNDINPDSTNFSSNSIMDIRSLNDEMLFIGTGGGLSYIDLSIGSEFEFGHVNALEFPKGGNPALYISHDLIAFSGVVDTIVLTGNEPKGTGLAYSMNDGESWVYLPQSIDSIPDPSFNGYQIISWGNQEINSLAVTTEINNITYDIAMDDRYIYTANWAGGLRRYNYLPTPDVTKSWEIIPLPMDEDRELYCENINVSQYEINPKDPSDGGNHNHKGFGVYVIEDTLWVGTAAGINKGIISSNNCIDWIRHFQSGLDNISGNWVIGFAHQQLNEKIRFWAITWATGHPETNALSYTDDGGLNWNISNPLGDESGKVYNLNVYENKIWAATEKGLYLSNDGIYWEKYDQFVDLSTGEKILSQSVFSSYFSKTLETLFIGTGDGLAIIDESMKITRFWDSPNPFSAYPNPFLINEHNQFNNNGHVRFIFLNPNDFKGKIDVYDFSMDRVIQLDDSHLIGDESEIIWNGRNEHGDKIANGVYFCRLTLNGKYYWTKLAVIN